MVVSPEPSPPTPPPAPVAEAPSKPPPVQQKHVACPDTEPGHGCVTLTFSVAPSVRERVKRPVRGDLHWALFRSDDVGMFGPGKHQPVYAGDLHNVDLSDPGTSAHVTVKDVEARKYKSLAYIDVKDSNSGTADPGDPVTLPHWAVLVRAGAHTRAPVMFDFVR